MKTIYLAYQEHRRPHAEGAAETAKVEEGRLSWNEQAISKCIREVIEPTLMESVEFFRSIGATMEVFLSTRDKGSFPAGSDIPCAAVAIVFQRNAMKQFALEYFGNEHRPSVRRMKTIGAMGEDGNWLPLDTITPDSVQADVESFYEEMLAMIAAIES